VTREDRIRNDYVKCSSDVASIADKMRGNRLRWFCHKMRREEPKEVRLVIKINVEGKRGRPKMRWLDTIEDDMRAVGQCIGDLKNRDKRWFRTKVVDPK